MISELNNVEIYNAFGKFINRDDSFAVMREGLNEYFVIKEILTPDILLKHIKGDITIGIFQISQDNKVRWICWDFDSDENKTLEDVFEDAKKLYLFLKENGYNPLLEFSGHRGYHVWIFCDKVNAEDAKLFAERMVKEVKVNPHEIFPKQIELNRKGYGSMVKLPLGIHKVSNRRSFFYDDNFTIMNTENSFNILKNQIIDRVSKTKTNLKEFVF